MSVNEAVANEVRQSLICLYLERTAGKAGNFPKSIAELSDRLDLAYTGKKINPNSLAAKMRIQLNQELFSTGQGEKASNWFAGKKVHLQAATEEKVSKVVKQPLNAPQRPNPSRVFHPAVLNPNFVPLKTRKSERQHDTFKVGVCE